uniref:Uncharacterized protein n=1 Tax=Lotus japonicus TaxID=34305 RepID=I3SY93_LOTJA|nr:unknown [Lotus japonicus]
MVNICRWRSALLWRTFFTTAVVAIVLRSAIQICSSGNCGLFGNGVILWSLVRKAWDMIVMSVHVSDL